MTPPHQEPTGAGEREYRITETLLCKLAHEDDALKVHYLLKEIRSRPLPPADAPCPQHKIWQHCPVRDTIATAAKAEEQKRIVKILEDYRFGLDYPDCPPGDTIKLLIESLRSTPTTPGTQGREPE